MPSVQYLKTVRGIEQWVEERSSLPQCATTPHSSCAYRYRGQYGEYDLESHVCDEILPRCDRQQDLVRLVESECPFSRGRPECRVVGGIYNCRNCKLKELRELSSGLGEMKED